MHHYNDVLETFGRQMPKALVMPIIQAKNPPKKLIRVKASANLPQQFKAKCCKVLIID